MTQYNLMIVEDHALIRFGLKTAFENKAFIKSIYEASSAEEAMKIVKSKNIDAVIMDLGLPNIDGIQATQNIKILFPDIKVIILTSHNSDEEVIDSIKAGASGYCSKDINPERLADVVLSIIEGAAWFDASVAKLVLKTVSHGIEAVKSKEISNYNLTFREKQVLKLIREGYNNNEIAKKLYVSVNTVKVHVSSIIQKLGVEDRTKAAVKALNDNII